MWMDRVTVRVEDFPRHDCYPFDLGWLRERVELPAHTRYRLVGVGIGGFRDREELPPQPELFAQ